jgi:predicted PurR-regulated permease PerM
MPVRVDDDPARKATPLTQIAAAQDHDRRQGYARGALALGLLLLGLFTLQDFLPALVWAVIFAIALWPLYQRSRDRMGRRGQAVLPLIFTLCVALIFVVPVGIVGVQLAREGQAATEWVRAARQNGVPEPDALHRLPWGEPAVSAWWQANLAKPGGAQALLGRVGQGGRVTTLGRTVGRAVTRRLTVFAFTLITLFFLFRDGEALVEQCRRAGTRMFGPGGERVGRQMVASVHGTVNGLVLVGLGEGVVLGIAYAAVGVPHATVFGALTAVAAMIPLAAPVVIAAAALLLLAQGGTVAAIAVFVGGMALNSAADHFIRPALIGGSTRLPFLWVLLGILGGVEVWGLLGLFIGPALMSALILLWREYTGTK